MISITIDNLGEEDAYVLRKVAMFLEDMAIWRKEPKDMPPDNAARDQTCENYAITEENANEVEDIDSELDTQKQEDELDQTGLPWDERIHSSSRTKTADGQWRQRRGVAPHLVKHVLSEHDQSKKVPLPPTIPIVVSKVKLKIPLPPAIPLIQESYIDPESLNPKTNSLQQPFIDITNRVKDLIKEGKLDRKVFQKLVLKAGLPSLASGRDHPELVEVLSDLVDEEILMGAG